MAKCQDCSEPTIIRSGSGTTVRGTGTASDPYLIELDDAFGSTLTVQDTDTVNMTLIGAGTTGSPFVLRADVKVELSDLADVEDPSGGPAAGEVPTYVGTFPSGHFEFRVPPPSPAGAVNVRNGLTGIGSAASPIAIRTSGTWGVGPLSGLGDDTTVGLETYVDVNGEVRARPAIAAQSVPWSSVINRPTSFPPSAHKHIATDIDLAEQRKLDVGKIGGRKISVTTTSSTPPAGASTGDLWFFPKGF